MGASLMSLMSLPRNDCNNQDEAVLHGRHCLHICDSCNNECNINFTHYHDFIDNRSQITLCKIKRNVSNYNHTVCNCGPWMSFW